MNTYIVFFRGINVGGKNILPMKDLKSTLEEIGFEGIKTYIQSGNVVLQTDEEDTKNISHKISLAVQKNYAFLPNVLVLKVKDLEESVKNNPFNTEQGKALHFYFLESTPKQPKMEVLNGIKTDTEEFVLKNEVFYLFAPDGIGRSKLAAKIEQYIGVTATARNWNTVNKILSMVNE